MILVDICCPSHLRTVCFTNFNISTLLCCWKCRYTNLLGVPKVLLGEAELPSFDIILLAAFYIGAERNNSVAVKCSWWSAKSNAICCHTFDVLSDQYMLYSSVWFIVTLDDL